MAKPPVKRARAHPAVLRATPYDQLPQLLTPAEVRSYLHIGRCALNERIRRGEIPSRRIWHQFRIPKTFLKPMVSS
jgi:hypothetical protein